MGVTRCASCGATIDDTARFCPSCGVPTSDAGIQVSESTERHLAASRSVVEQRQSYRPFVFGVAAVAVAAGALAMSRSDGTIAPTAEEATTTTMAPELSTTTTTPFEPPPTTAPAAEPGEPVDVSGMPDELRDRWILLIERDELTAVDLSTGESVEITEHELGRTFRVFESSDRGLVVVDERSGSGKLVDWDLTSTISLGVNLWAGRFTMTDETIWVVSDGTEEVSTLVAIDADGERTEVRDLPAWIQLVGSTDGRVLLSTFVSPGVYSVGLDGELRRSGDAIATIGGEDWYVEWACDDQLRCRSELVDLRTERRQPIDITLFGGTEPLQRSADGRRLLLRDWSEPLGGLIVIDADDLTVRPIPGRAFDTSNITADEDLRFAVWSQAGTTGLVIGDLTNGAEWELPVTPGVLPVLTPPGWEPPVVVAEDPSAEASGA
ncbi:MAG: zinc ribbon domain-containing protein [Actinomycetota bacterium]